MTQSVSSDAAARRHGPWRSSRRARLCALAVGCGLLLATVVGVSSGAPVEDRARAVGVVECSPTLLRRHNPGLAETKQDAPDDTLVCFDGFISNFDRHRRDDASTDDLRHAYLRVPRWVSQEVTRARRSPESNARPSTWFTVPVLNDQAIAPTDSSYKYSRSFRDRNPNWYDRGHMAQKYLAERLAKPGGDPKTQPAWFTHNVVNAVPQRSRFNSFPWQQLECYTGALANKHGRIWIVTGPVFFHDEPTDWLLERGRKALPVAIPDALFKIVARRGEAGRWEALAFVYPQDHPDYHKSGPWPPKKWLTSLARVETLTG